MRLFVTGATGFVGSHFVLAALVAGHEVVGLRRSSHSVPRVPIKPAPSWLDKTMDGLVASDFAGVDVLVHLAAHTANVPYDTLENCLWWNQTVPLQMFRRAIDAGVTNFLVAGSCFEYGRSAERYEFIPPDASLEPTLSYPTSKAAASVAFHGLAAEHRLRLAILRLSQVYGEGEQETRFWPSLRRAAMEGRNFPMSAGEQVRDFIEVKDVAKALVSALDFKRVEPGIAYICNVGTGKAQTLRTFAEYWWQHWAATGLLLVGEVPYRKNDVMRIVPLVHRPQ